MQRRRRVHQTVILAVALLMLSLLATMGCGTPFRTGTVQGTLRIQGGPPPGERPEPGKITLLNKSERTVVIDVPNSGAFAVRVPVATYRVYGSIPKYGYTTKVCFGAPPSITVTAGSSTKIVMNCNTR